MRFIRGAACVAFVLTVSAWGQPEQQRRHQSGAAREIGAGAGTVGIGAAKGAGNIAKGAGKGAVDLVTLHPIDAGTSVGRGAAAAGKDVTVGTVKGTGKMSKGIGRACKHLF